VAERERAEARLHEERAQAHELGLADDEPVSVAQDEPVRSDNGNR
jgi:hypothetical protein